MKAAAGQVPPHFCFSFAVDRECIFLFFVVSNRIRIIGITGVVVEYVEKLKCGETHEVKLILFQHFFNRESTY